jgi:ipoprotein LpqH
VNAVKRRSTAVVGCMAFLGLALTGCSASSGHGTSAPATSAAPAANVKVVVDGQLRHVQNSVQCVTAANMVTVVIGSDRDGVGMTLTAGENPKVNDLTVGMIDGILLSYNNSDIGPAPAVTKTGSTYKVVGTASGPSPNGAQAVSKPFNVEFTCPPDS